MQIIGDGKILGIPYLPVRSQEKGSGYNQNSPDWNPNFDFSDHLTKDDREKIPYPEYSPNIPFKLEPDRRGGRTDPINPGNSSGTGRNPNGSSGGGYNGDTSSKRRPKSPIDLQDALGIPPWQETLWDELINPRGAVGGFGPKGAIPFNPQGDTKEPPVPKTPRGPQENLCGTGPLPHWKYGGEHNANSLIVQFRVIKETEVGGNSSVNTPDIREDDGIEHYYAKDGLNAYLRYQLSMTKAIPEWDFTPPYEIGGSNPPVIESVQSKDTYGLKFGYPWSRRDVFIKRGGALAYASKRKVKLLSRYWFTTWPLPNTPANIVGLTYWRSNVTRYYLAIQCLIGFASAPKKLDYHPPGKPYNRKDEMGCQWQKDEVSYTLPELKIGDSTIGGNSINIDDGLIPLANFVCKSMEMIHKGLGLNQLGAELPKLVTDRGGTKIKPSSLAELTQWQFDNVSSLVGLPVETAITNLENSTKDIVFRNVQDCISYMFQQQKESDLDLMVIENYCTRIAQQLEAVTQISLRQQADIEMLVKELGFRWKWETKTRKSLYKIGMSDEDEKTGILELFKGGEVSYPVRIWDDKLDSRQIAMTTNLYSEIASKSNFHSFNTDSPIPGLDARSKMSKTGEEDWKEWVKGINTPEKGTISGGTTPYIEEYSQTSITAKKIAEPASGLSLFMKPKKAKVTGPK